MSAKAYIPPHRRRGVANPSNASSSSSFQRDRIKGRNKRWEEASSRSSESRHSSPHKEQEQDDDDYDDEVDDYHLFCAAFSRVCCINLRRRKDRWESFRNRAQSSLGRQMGETFLAKVERFEAVDGAAFLLNEGNGNEHDNDNHRHFLHQGNKIILDNNSGTSDDDDVMMMMMTMPAAEAVVSMEWDATNNASYDRHIKEPMIKLMTPGEVGCAISHVKLWMELAFSSSSSSIPSSTNCDDQTRRGGGGDSTVLILEDDAVMYNRGKQQQQQQHHCEFRGRAGGKGRRRHNPRRSCFLDAFATMWKILPNDWEILYLGISDRGERHYVDKNYCCYPPDNLKNVTPTPESEMIEISIFRPSYGFHTHAYALKASAAARLLSNLPVTGPLDVWLADNKWFGLNVYCAIVANEGWKGQGAPLIGQRRHDISSDISQSGR